jgi:hypothetical protein
MSGLLALLVALSAGSAGQTEISLLGGVTISDYSVTSQLPEEIDYNEGSSAGCFELRAGHGLAGNLLLGIGMGLTVSDYEWRAESDSSHRIERVEEGHLELYGDWRLPVGMLDPFARLGVGVSWGRLERYYEHGEYVFDDADGVSTAPCLSLGGGFRAEILSSAFLQFETGYRFIFRKEFSGWQVTDVDGMNSWRVLLGLGARL